jgi:hypothetical protein
MSPTNDRDDVPERKVTSGPEVAVPMLSEDWEMRSAGRVEEAWMARTPDGVVVPIPTFPAGSIMNEVADEEPTTNWLVFPATGFTARRAKGEEVPIPKSFEVLLKKSVS